MGDNDWLKNLKIGDSVFIETSAFGTNNVQPDKVKKITKTMIILDSGTRFHMDGNVVRKWEMTYSRFIHPNNEAIREKYLIQNFRKELITILSGFRDIINYPNLSREQLEKIISSLREIKNEIAEVKK
jgi:hypothetical protein